MTTDSPAPENVHLRYQVVSLFEHADTSSKEMAQLRSDDRFSVLGTEGEYYRVRLVDGSVGFIFAHNLVGSHMPLTATEQHSADERAAAAARPPGGWRALVQRISRRPQQRPV
jgi:hypothetical protein